MRLRKPTQNFIVDVAALAALLAMIATGMLLRYVLPAGSGHWVGAHGGGNRLVTTVWGLTRHEWGDVHFWASVALMTVLALHLILHWKWIASMVQGKAREGSGHRAALGVVGLVGLVLLAVAPLLSPVEEHPRPRPSGGAVQDTVLVHAQPADTLQASPPRRQRGR